MITNLYTFKGRVKDLLPDLEKAMKLHVKHDTTEYEVIINSVWCDIGSHSVSEDRIMGRYDISVCEDCHEHYTDKWN